MEGKTDLLNPYLSNISILYPLKIPENKNGYKWVKHILVSLVSNKYRELTHSFPMHPFCTH